MTDAITRLRESISSQAILGARDTEKFGIHGRFRAECWHNGKMVWDDDYDNLVTTAGKNHLLDNYLAASAFTQTGPIMGLISSASWSAVNAADTMSSHAGWLEAGSTNAPTFTARITTASGWSAASAGAKALSASLSFTMTGAGTLKGSFLVLGSGAVVTLMNTSGTLFSAGAFSGGDRVVISSDVVNVSYSLTLT